MVERCFLCYDHVLEEMIMASVGFESLIRQLVMKLERQEHSVAETKAQLEALRAK